MVVVYGKKECKICEEAIAKLKILGLQYEYHDIEEAITPKEGWRETDATTVVAWHKMIGEAIPMLVVDGKPYDYPGAMRVLKQQS